MGNSERWPPKLLSEGVSGSSGSKPSFRNVILPTVSQVVLKRTIAAALIYISQKSKTTGLFPSAAVILALTAELDGR